MASFRTTHRGRAILVHLAVLALGAATIAMLLAAAGPGQARELRSGIAPGAGKRILGVTYGPYLGKRCRHARHRRCELIGIDVVFDRRAARVVAVAGDQRIALRTPGKHNGIRHRDWVGNFTRAGLARRKHAPGTNLIYVPVELRVRFADGRRARALFPHVVVSPGWG